MKTIIIIISKIIIIISIIINKIIISDNLFNNLFLLFNYTKNDLKSSFHSTEISLYKQNKKKFINLNNYKNNTKIKIGIYCHSLSNGGVERNTAILLNYLSKIEQFELYIFNKIKTKNEYKLSEKVKRFIISYEKRILKRYLLKKEINIFIYQLYDEPIIKMLKSIKNLKIIFYIHSCFLYWIYKNNKIIFKKVYNEYKNSKYVISLIPFENDYIFKKWGINSIHIDNFLTYQYEKVIQSNLSSKKILMLGRADDKNKRFDLGIKAMKFIIKEILDSQMIIISDDNNIDNLKNLIKTLYIEKNIKFVGYTSTPEIYFKDASLHIFPSIAEAFPMVLSETKIYGIPNIVLGIDYVSTVKEGVIIIYDEKPETIAKFAIKILKDISFRKKLGKNARRSMKKFNNEILFNLFFRTRDISLISLLYLLKNENYAIPKKRNINFSSFFFLLTIE